MASVNVIGHVLIRCGFIVQFVIVCYPKPTTNPNKRYWWILSITLLVHPVYTLQCEPTLHYSVDLRKQTYTDIRFR